MIKKKLMRKTSYLLVAAMSLSLVAGCAKEENDTTKTEKTTEVLTTKETEKPAETKTETTQANSEEVSTEAPTKEASTQEETKEASTEAETEAPTEEPTKEATSDEAAAEQKRFDEFTSQMVLDMIGTNYFTISDHMENPEKFGISLSDIDDYSIGSYAIDTDYSEAKKQNDAWIKELESFDYDKLTKAQQMTYDKLAYEFDITDRGFGLKLYSHPLNSMQGIMSNLGIALYNFQFDDINDVEAYHKIIQSIPQMLSEIPGYIQYQIDNYGYYPSDDMIDGAIGYSAALRELENNPLLDAYDAKIDAMDLTTEQKDAYKKANREYVVDTLFAEFEKFEKSIKAFDTDTNEIKGLANYEGGAEYYDYYIKAVMGLELNAEEMMTLLEKRLAKDLDEYVEAYNSGALLYASYSAGTYKLPYDSKDVNEIFEFYQTAMSEDFPMYRMPDYDIQNLPPALQIDGLGAYYMQGEFDDSGKKIIRINPKVTGEDSSLDLDMTLVHEGIAGHMLQYACAEENPYIEWMFSELGYTEGWAMYAEMASIDYSGINKKIATWKRIDSIYSYYLISIVDLGVNGLGWDKDEVAEYLESYGITGAETIDAIIEEVASAPASLLPYALGYVITDEMMQKYKDLSGEDVDLLKMHEKYMSIGNSSFEVVSKYFFEGLED